MHGVVMAIVWFLGFSVGVGFGIYGERLLQRKGNKPDANEGCATNLDGIWVRIGGSEEIHRFTEQIH